MPFLKSLIRPNRTNQPPKQRLHQDNGKTLNKYEVYTEGTGILY